MKYVFLLPNDGLNSRFYAPCFFLGFLGCFFLQMIWGSVRKPTKNQARHWEMQFFLVTNEPEKSLKTNGQDRKINPRVFMNDRYVSFLNQSQTHPDFSDYPCYRSVFPK